MKAYKPRDYTDRFSQEALNSRLYACHASCLSSMLLLYGCQSTRISLATLFISGRSSVGTFIITFSFSSLNRFLKIFNYLRLHVIIQFLHFHPSKIPYLSQSFTTEAGLSSVISAFFALFSPNFSIASSAFSLKFSISSSSA